MHFSTDHLYIKMEILFNKKERKLRTWLWKTPIPLTPLLIRSGIHEHSTLSSLLSSFFSTTWSDSAREHQSTTLLPLFSVNCPWWKRWKDQRFFCKLRWIGLVEGIMSAIETVANLPALVWLLRLSSLGLVGGPTRAQQKQH